MIAELIVLDDDTLRLVCGDIKQDFDVNDELSPLYFKQFMNHNRITDTECTLFRDEDEGVLMKFFENAERLFDGMDASQTHYIN